MGDYSTIPEGFTTWTQAERDRWLDERDKRRQLAQFDRAPEVEIDANDRKYWHHDVPLIRIIPASSVADPASPFTLTVDAARELRRRIDVALDGIPHVARTSTKRGP